MPITRGEHDRLVFTCNACNGRVTGKEGSVHIDMDAVNAVETAARKWREANPSGGTLAALMEYPEPAVWLVHHDDCLPSATGYAIEVARIDTWPRLVHWTAHLMEKTWLAHTNWGAVLDRIGEDA